jgi:S1-C subfamily serine protease
MQCPKCGHQQHAGTECEACGIVFAKYDQYLKRQQEIQQATETAETHKPGSKHYLPAGIAIITVLAIAGYLLSGSTNEPPVSSINNAADAQLVTTTTAQQLSGQPVPAGILDLDHQLQRVNPPGNTIERARNATVFIETAVSRGSGFFVSGDCKIITNKHVINRDEEWLEKNDKLMAEASRILDFARNRVTKKRENFLKSCTKCDDQTFKAYIGDADDMLEKAMNVYNKQQDRLFRLRNQTRFNISLTDGSEHTARLLRVSHAHDLAILKLDDSSCPLITPGSHTTVNIGEALFTIGSPIGLKHTVTSGVFSGIVEDDNKTYLQTDAPINPGNSGGPLITKQGHVIGVNTMVLSNTEGIGFAIPMDVVRQEFDI